MCIIIDFNTITNVFNPDDEHHGLYRPVLEWIVNGKGKMVCGGTQYWSELSKMGRYVRFLNQLKNAGKVVKVDDAVVDEKAKELKKLCKDSDFDDPHIVALLIVSGCNLLCSKDERSYPYVTEKEWYPKGRKIPKIYKHTSFKRASVLLSDENIAAVCKPCIKLRKTNAEKLMPK